MTMLESNFKTVTLKINPTVMPFLTATTIYLGKRKNILRPFIAPVNHNVLNNEKAVNIAHTILGNFCHGDAARLKGRNWHQSARGFRPESFNSGNPVA